MVFSIIQKVIGASRDGGELKLIRLSIISVTVLVRLWETNPLFEDEIDQSDFQ